MFPYLVAAISLLIHTTVFGVGKYITKNSKVSSSFASITHAMLVIPITLCALIEYYEDEYVNTSFLTTIAGISTGYFLTDSITVLISSKFTKKERVAFILHHIIAFVMIYVVVFSGITCHRLTLLTLLCEISSMFANFHLLLTHYMKDYRKLRFINGLIMTLSFAITRLVIIPIGYYLEFDCIFDSLYTACMINIIYVPFTILNLYWTKEMIKGIVKFSIKREEKEN
jgi:hypothetical protein